jgi:poly [ADP-ribose] polymerase 2/3/4
MVELNYEEDEEQEVKQDEKEVKENEEKRKKVESKLDVRVQDLVKLISNVQVMQDTLKEFDIDIKKMPLGKLSKTQISNGYEKLKEIQEAIQNKSTKKDLADLSSEFYSLIPHDFGRRKPTIIDSIDLLKIKMEMLEALSDMEYFIFF